jgi:uncharacterized protein
MADGPNPDGTVQPVSFGMARVRAHVPSAGRAPAWRRVLRVAAVAASACIGLLLSGVASAQQPLPPVARVVDETGTLTPDQQAALRDKLAAFEQRKGSQIAVVIVPTTEPESIEQYGIRLGDAWKLGRKGVDDGAILIVALRDHRLRIEVGYGLEGVIPDARAKRIVSDAMTPYFRHGDFYGGIDAGVDRIISLVDAEALPEAAPRQRGFGGGLGGGSSIGLLLVVGLFVAVLLGRVMSRMGTWTRAPLSLASGGIVGGLVWWLLGSLLVAGVFGIAAFVVSMVLASATGSGPRGGGGFGGFGGLGGFGGGGLGGGGGDLFSGGGGGFGGGGASGSW